MNGEVAAAGLTIFWSTFIGPVVDPTVNTLVQRAQEFLSKRKEQGRWADAAEHYRQHILKHYNQLTILGKSERVELSDVFTYVNIFEGTLARIPYDYEELQKQAVDRFAFQHQKGKPTDGIALVKQGENLFIVGKPGAGKTTFLRHLAVHAAKRFLNRVPIFVSLNAWANSPYGEGDHPQLLPFLVHEFTVCHFDDPADFIEQLLQSGKALVLFDGLDEVKQENDQRRKLRQLIEDFARQYDQCQHLVTCRIAASDYLFKGFRDVEMADFTAEQVERYATLWFASTVKKRSDFLDQLSKPENAGVRELCSIPLLLSMVCLYFDYRQDFPPNRAELYERALNYLLDEWDASRDIRRDEIARGETLYRELSPERKKRLFARIAARTFEQGIYFFRQRDLEQWIREFLAALPNVKPADAINAKAVLKAIEAELDYDLYYSWGYAALFAAKELPRDDNEVKAALAAYPQLLAQTGQLAQAANVPALASALAKVRIPGITARIATWQKLADQLWALMTQRDLVHDWELGKEQWDRLNAYFAANTLLVDCLKMAVVAERQAILNSLLLPPAG